MRNWWWIPLVAFVAVFLKAAILTPWVAGRIETAAVEALQDEGLDRVSFVGVDGISGFSSGARVVLEGPAEERSLAISVVEARDEIGAVGYRLLVDEGGS